MKFNKTVNHKVSYSIVKMAIEIKQKLSLALPKLFFIENKKTERTALLWLRVRVDTALVRGIKR